MSHTKNDPLLSEIARLRRILAMDAPNRDQSWAEVVHTSLGKVAAAVQAEVQDAEQSLGVVGEINPDYKDVPATARHVESMREQLLQLGEKVHVLRAEIARACENQSLDSLELRMRGEEIANLIQGVRRIDDAYLVDALNANPGSGE